MANGSGTQAHAKVYTAFGELRANSTNHRYGYAGAWGYQAHDDFPFLHVGWRYYDPSTGRFLQRDPIGIWGGVNVFGYVRNRPTLLVDPEGALPEDPPPNWGGHFPAPRPKLPETPQQELRRIRRRLIWTGIGYGLCAAGTFWAPPVSAACSACAVVSAGAAGLL